jgi:hypothetical protein
VVPAAAGVVPVRVRADRAEPPVFRIEFDGAGLAVRVIILTDAFFAGSGYQ